MNQKLGKCACRDIEFHIFHFLSIYTQTKLCTFFPAFFFSASEKYDYSQKNCGINSAQRLFFNNNNKNCGRMIWQEQK